MTEETKAVLLERLETRLGLADPDETALSQLSEALTEAEEALLLYLNAEELPERFYGYLVKLAAVYYQRDAAETPDVKSASYSEGDVSQSETYLTGEEYQKQAETLLASLARYRQVTAK